MYQALIDIHNFRQLLKINPEGTQEICSGLERMALMYGASCREVVQGRMMVGFTIHRPGDSLFVVESVLSLYQYLLGHRQELSGFTVLLDSGDGGMESERHLRKLLVSAIEDESLWLGSQAAIALKPYLKLDQRHGIWRFLERMDAGAENINVNDALFESFMPLAEFEDFVRRAIDSAPAGPLVLAVADDGEPASGDLANALIDRLVGLAAKNHFIWILGQNQLDPTPAALTRTLFNLGDVSIDEWLTDAERHTWQRMGRFMFQNAVSTIPGVFSLGVSPEYPDQLFWQAWSLYVSALQRKTASLGLPFFIHIEHFALLGPDSQAMIRKTVELLSGNGSSTLVLLITGDHSEGLPWEVSDDQIFPLGPLSRSKFPDISALPPVLSFCDRPLTLPRRIAASIRFLGKRYSQSMSDGLPITLPDDPPDTEINRIVIKLMVASCEDIVQEVYYALVITYGLIPLPVLLDFLSYLAIERIRHPSIIQNLHRHGLIRHEELVIPSFPHCADDLAGLLGGKTREIQDKLDSFLSLRLREKRLPLKLDLFTLVNDLSEPENFYEICFRYGQELLDAGLYGLADHVLDCASTRLRSAGTSQQKARLQAAITYLSSRGRLLQDASMEIPAILSALNGLTATDHPPINAYVSLQKARCHFYQGESDQALREVKQAVMQFQELSDFAGLADSHILFGQILLGRERLIEARDYFILARNTATRSGAVYQDVMAGLYDILVVFILGYQSRTLEALSDSKGIIENARNHGFFSPVVYLEFLRGRVWFELGAYQTARAAFGVALGLCQVYPNPAASCLMKRWIARCDIHSEDTASGLATLTEMPVCRESLLFQAEAHLMLGQPGHALSAVEGLLSMAPVRRATHPERLAWEDGFANLESKILPQAANQDTITNLAVCYRAFCLSKTGRQGEAADILFAFTRDKKRWAQDPQTHLYLFLYSQTLGRPGSGCIDDCATILGKAVKVLQERSSRIEEPTHKQSFLKAAYWNRRLLQEAKTFNLA